MARIGSFSAVTSETNKIHDLVECGFRSFTVRGTKLLQLDTYGSSGRANPGKVSQSIQLDEEGAGELLRILVEAFPGLQRSVPK